MRAYLCLVALTILTMTGCGRFTSSTADGKAARASASAKLRNPAYDLIVGKPISHGNLTIFPVTCRIPKTADRYITLDEGLRAGTVEVFEIGQTSGATPNEPATQAPMPAPANPSTNEEPIVPPEPERERSEQSPQPLLAPNSDGVHIAQPTSLTVNDEPFVQAPDQSNDVNRLMVLNRSDKPLYLMPGEVILGGSQDRTIGQELVLAPNPEPVPVDVYCVEHGRWGRRGAEETAGLLVSNSHSMAIADLDSFEGPVVESSALLEVAQKADEGKFVASVGQLSKSGRLAVQAAKSQSEVWDTVAKENSKAGVSNSSGTFTGNYTDEDAVKRLNPYIDSLQSKVSDQEQVVGVIVAINGKPASMDVFESTPLFRKLWPKLLKSYALDAANEARGDAKESGAIACSQTAAEKFLREAMSGSQGQTAVDRGLATTTRQSAAMISFTTELAPTDLLTSSEEAALGVGFGGGVHVSAFAQ